MNKRSLKYVICLSGACVGTSMNYSHGGAIAIHYCVVAFVHLENRWPSLAVKPWKTNSHTLIWASVGLDDLPMVSPQTAQRCDWVAPLLGVKLERALSSRIKIVTCLTQPALDPIVIITWGLLAGGQAKVEACIRHAFPVCQKKV